MFPFNKKKPTHDLYIDVIRYAVKRNDTFPLGDIYKELGLNTSQIELLKEQVRARNILFTTGMGSRIDVDDGKELPVCASSIDRFRLIEHDELTEARDSARKANYWAVSAMVVSIVLAGISMLQNKDQSESNDTATIKLLESLQKTNDLIKELNESNSALGGNNLAANIKLQETLQRTNELIQAMATTQSTTYTSTSLSPSPNLSAKARPKVVE